nr:MAG TPA: Spermidine synthase tetramerization domain [Caudoviricetes sp.]
MLHRIVISSQSPYQKLEIIFKPHSGMNQR